MHRETREWKRDLISQIFKSEEVVVILSIPISEIGFENKLIWRPTKEGYFSVKSVHHLKNER